jgi:hypothetical protein
VKTDSNLLENLIKDGKCIGHDWNHVFGKRLTFIYNGSGRGYRSMYCGFIKGLKGFGYPNGWSGSCI